MWGLGGNRFGFRNVGVSVEQKNNVWIQNWKGGRDVGGSSVRRGGVGGCRVVEESE